MMLESNLLDNCKCKFDPLNSKYWQIGTFANSEDPDEMLHITAFHLGLHCLLR